MRGTRLVRRERVATQLVVGLVPVEPGSQPRQPLQESETWAHLRLRQRFARKFPLFETREFGRSPPLFAVVHSHAEPSLSRQFLAEPEKSQQRS